MNTPTLQELYESILQDLESEVGINIPLFGKFFLRGLAAVQAAKLKIYYLASAFVLKNIWVDTADPESIGGTLERFGRVKLNRSPFPATQGRYQIQVTGTIGATVPAGTIFKADDDSAAPGKLFQADTAFTLIAATGSLEIRALEGGLDSRLEVGNNVTSTSPLNLINNQAEVTAENEIPLNREDLEQYREITIQSFQLEPQGGAVSDYRLWSADAQGVQRVYPYATPGVVNGVDVYVEATPLDSIDGNGTPSPALLTDVSEVIEFDPDTTQPLNLRGRRPINVVLQVIPITPLEVDITINDVVGIGAAEQALIQAAIEQLLFETRPFIAGADIIENKNDVLNINELIFTIQNVIPATASFGAVDLVVDSVAIPISYTFQDGDIPFLNSLNYVP